MVDIEGNMSQLQQVIIKAAEGSTVNITNTDPDQIKTPTAETDNN